MEIEQTEVGYKFKGTLEEYLEFLKLDKPIDEFALKSGMAFKTREDSLLAFKAISELFSDKSGVPK